MVDNLKDQQDYMYPELASDKKNGISDYTDLESLNLPIGSERISNLAIVLESLMRDVQHQRENREGILEKLD